MEVFMNYSRFLIPGWLFLCLLIFDSLAQASKAVVVLEHRLILTPQLGNPRLGFSQVLCSGNCKFLITADSHLWDTHTGKLIRHFAGVAVNMSVDGKSLVTYDVQHTLGDTVRTRARLYDVATAKQRVLIEDPDENFIALDFSPNGKWLLTANYDTSKGDYSALCGM